MKVRNLLLGLFVIFFNISIASAKASGDELTYGSKDLKGIFFDNSTIKLDSKPILLVFGQDGCHYCALLRAGIINDAAIKNLVVTNFSPYYVNISHDRIHSVPFLKLSGITSVELSKLYNLAATPTIVFIDSAGKTIFRVGGFPGNKRFSNMLKYVISNSWQKGSTESERIKMFLEFEKTLKD